MRQFTFAALALALVAIFTGWVRAEPAAPTTQSAAREPGAVLIVPFVAPADPKFKSLGADIQQDLATAIAPNLRGRALAPTTAPAPGDDSAALAAARDARAAAVVFGRVQSNGNEIRITGQVLDVGLGKSLGNLKVTGPTDRLFELEDALGPQVIASLPTELLNVRGLSMVARRSTPPRVIYLPGDAATSSSNPNAPIDGGYAGPIPPPAPLILPGGPAPYSPYAGSYPYRFRWPYAHLFSYDYDPDPFLPLYPPWNCEPDRFAVHHSAHAAAAHPHR